VTAGGTLRVTIGTRNGGRAGARASTTSVYLSKDTKRDRGDALIGKLALRALAAAKSRSGTVVATIPVSSAAGA
jgi:hypothetical protein